MSFAPGISRTHFRSRSKRANLITRDHTGTPSATLLVSNCTYRDSWPCLLTALIVDLIDSMLVVDPAKRATVDECLAHPWMNAETPGVNDSTGGLVGGVAGLDVSRRGPIRERTLLASLNSVQITKINAQDGQEPVEIYQKNPRTVALEPRPFDARKPDEFMALGGKGDPVLFGHDVTSHYTKDDIEKSHQTSEEAGPAEEVNGTKSKPSKGTGKGTKQ